jgi:hypothetical protein
MDNFNNMNKVGFQLNQEIEEFTENKTRQVAASAKYSRACSKTYGLLALLLLRLPLKKR